MKQDRIDLALGDDEFAAMMKEFDSSGKWMREQLALKRAASSSGALKQSSADATGQKAAQNRNAIDDYDGHVEVGSVDGYGMGRF